MNEAELMGSRYAVFSGQTRPGKTWVLPGTQTFSPKSVTPFADRPRATRGPALLSRYSLLYFLPGVENLSSEDGMPGWRDTGSEL